MTNTSGSRRFLYGRLGLLIIAAVVVIGLMAFAVWLLLGFGVYTMRGEVSVLRGYVHVPGQARTQLPADPAKGTNKCRCCGRRMSMCRSRWLPPPDPFSKVARTAEEAPLRSNSVSHWEIGSSLTNTPGK